MRSRLSPSAQKQFEHAVALMGQGRLASAEIICTELLARWPEDAELAHFGGILANRMGRYDLAIERLARCVRLDPKRARSHAALGLAQDSAGLLEESRQSFAAAVRAEPRFAEAHNGLGVVANRLGRREEALASFERAIALNPRFVEARLNAARALQQVGRSEAAAQHYRDALQLGGDNADVLRQCAVGLNVAGDYGGAIDAMRRYLERHRDDDLRGQLAQALESAGRSREADVEIDQALAGSPSDAALHNVRGALLQKRGDSKGALEAFQRALALRPDLPEVRINLAVALRQLGQTEESARELALARASPMNDPVALTHLAMLTGEAGDSHAAIELLEAAIALDPARPEPHGLLGVELLRVGRVERGWNEYLYRPSRGTEIYAAIAQRRYPPVLPDVLRGRSFALLGEQGLGDALFFLRYAKPLADAGARLHVVRTDRRLELMVARAMPIESWTDGDRLPPDAPAVWIGDLPVVARPVAGDVAPTLRIAPLAERVERMRARLPAGGRPRVGVAWRAGTPKGEGPAGHNLLRKAIPVDVLARGLAARGAACIVVQRNPDPDELRRFGEIVESYDFSDVNEDLEDMLALLSLLDDYVGVSSTNVHLLAAAGGGGHILVPHPTEWRWQLAGSSPWFPGFGVHRQARGGDWSAALQFLQGEES